MSQGSIVECLELHQCKHILHACIDINNLIQYAETLKLEDTSGIYYYLSINGIYHAMVLMGKSSG